MSTASGFVRVDWDSRQIDIEYRWAGEDDAGLPLVVFLHEGLGSQSMWKDFPDRLCRVAGCRGLVYSRPGYGWSTARAARHRLEPDFMHRQAYELLPALLEALGIDTTRQPPWLLGHSDGASIALLYAAGYPDRLAGAIVLAPHILVEAVSIESIERARQAYLETDLKSRLERYHADPDSAFRGWNDIWLSPSFRDWSIVAELDSIRCPLLAVQGVDDEYGTLEQIRGIARRVAHAQLLELPCCGHSPQRDQPDELLREAACFLARNGVSPAALRGAV